MYGEKERQHTGKHAPQGTIADLAPCTNVMENAQ